MRQTAAALAGLAMLLAAGSASAECQRAEKYGIVATPAR